MINSNESILMDRDIFYNTVKLSYSEQEIILRKAYSICDRCRSCCKLASQTHIDKATVMNLRTGDAENITLKKLNHILKVLNYKLSMEKVKRA